MKINLFDNNFRHVKNQLGFDAASHCRPKRMQWVRDNMCWDGATVFTDAMCFSENVKSVQTNLKVAWLMEPPSIYAASRSIRHVQDNFDLILSYLSFEELGIKKEKYVWIPSGGTWVDPQDNVKKTKLASLIASSKNYAPGHQLRHQFAKAVEGKIDLLGNGYKKINDKSEGHNDYMFSVVIENERFPKFFSEKLLDCMLCKSIPVYWGAYDVNDIFDTRGILSASNFDELINIFENLNENLYFSLLDSVNNNFEIAKRYASTDDIIYDIILEKIKEKK